MVIVRLQVHVLPWQDHTAADGVRPARQDPILPWNEPCDEHATIQTLAEKIVARFKSIHVGKGDLNIKYLQDYWGSLLDVTTTVGQNFIDRACGVDVSNSIVKVVRFPPTESELANPLRYASLAPESSARPRRRTYEEFAESGKTSRGGGEWENGYDYDHLISSSRSANKRQRTEGRATNDIDEFFRPFQSSEVSENVAVQRSWETPVQLESSSVQVTDSQRFPPRKRRNPYGMPLSLFLRSPQERLSLNQRSNFAIPESPPSRTTSFNRSPSVPATDLELGDAKSESPELDSSVRGVSHADFSGKRPETKDLNEGETGTRDQFDVADPKTPSLRSGQVQAKDTGPESREEWRDQAVAPEPGGWPSMPKYRLSSQVSRTDVQGNTEESPEATPQPHGLEGLMQHSRNHEDASKEHSGVGRERSPCAPKNPLGGVDPRGHTGDEHPSLSQTGFLQSSNSSHGSERAPRDDYTGKEKQVGGPHDVAEVNDDLSPDPNPKAKAPDKSQALAQSKDLMTPEDAFTGETSTVMEPVGQKSMEKGKGDKAGGQNILQKDEQEISRDLMREMIRREKLLRKYSKGAVEVGGKMAASKPSKHKEILPEPNDAKVKEPKLREEKLTGMKSAAVNLHEEGAQPVTVRAAKLHGEKESVMINPSEEKKKQNAVAKSKALGQEVIAAKPEIQSQTSPPARPEASLAVEGSGKDKHAATGREVGKADKANEVPRKPEAAKLVTPKLQKVSDARGGSSASWKDPNESSRTRKSMTPAFPERSLNKLKLTESKSARRTPSQQLANEDVLVPGNILRTPSILSRPVAFSNDPITMPSSQGSAPESPTQKDMKSKGSRTLKGKIGESSIIKREPDLGLHGRKSKDFNIQKARTQTKLKVSRDKMMKGRVIDPPIRPATTPQELVILSSENEETNSSSCSDHDVQTMTVKAGPSSKRKVSSRLEPPKNKAPAKDSLSSGLGTAENDVVKNTAKHAAPALHQPARARGRISERSKVTESKVTTSDSRPQLSSAVNHESHEPRVPNTPKADSHTGAKFCLPAMKSETVVADRASTSSGIVDRKSSAILPSSKNSSPRAPAQYMSGAVSISSESNSFADSGSKPGSPSASASDSACERESEADADELGVGKKDMAFQQKTARKATNALATEASSTMPNAKTPTSSPPAPLATLKPTNFANPHGSKVHNQTSPEGEANEQLQRECRQSKQPTPRQVPSKSYRQASAEEPRPINVAASNDGSVDSGLPPSNVSYPRLSELKKGRPAKMPQRPIPGPLLGSKSEKLDPKPLAQSTTGIAYLSTSSSSEDDSDQDEDTDEEPSKAATKTANRNSPNVKPKPSKAIERIMKIANKVESFYWNATSKE